MKKQSVASYIAKVLDNAGVKRIWGVTGDSLNGLTDSLRRQALLVAELAMKSLPLLRVQKLS